jgi:hypothetical protein
VSRGEDGKATTRWRRRIGSWDCRWDRRNGVEGEAEPRAVKPREWKFLRTKFVLHFILHFIQN